MAIAWTIVAFGALLHFVALDITTAAETTTTKDTIATTISTTNVLPTTSVPELIGTTTQHTVPQPTTQSTTQPTTQLTTQPETSDPITTAVTTEQTTKSPFTSQITFTSVTIQQVNTTVQPSTNPTLTVSAENTQTTSNLQDQPSSAGPTTTNPVTQTSTSVQSQPPTPTPNSPKQSSLPDQSTTVPSDFTHSVLHSTSGKYTSSKPSSASLSNPAPDSTATISQKPQPDPSKDEPGITTPNIFKHNYDLSSQSDKPSVVFDTCKTLAKNVKGTCNATVEIKDNELHISAVITAEQNILPDIYKSQEQTNTQTPKVENNDTPDTLIAILASCGALVLILCLFAAYCTYHRRSYRKNQQHLTEELQTVENGYHDNPTLEVMEVQPEMQEKKVALNGEFNDSWIVPIDNLLKEDIPDEEDTHL